MNISTDVVMSASIFLLLAERGYGIFKDVMNRNNGHCKDHHRLMSMVERLTDSGKEDSFSKTIEHAVRRGMSVSSPDPRD